MSVRLDNFVQINIKKRVPNASNKKFDTAVFVTGEQTALDKYYSKSGTGNGATKATAAPCPADANSQLASFFENGGKYIHAVNALTVDDNTTPTAITNVADDEILVFGATTASNYGTALQGVHQKIWLYPQATVPTGAITGGAEGKVYKYTPSAASNPKGIGALAAYYTNFDFNSADGVKDYCFTAESVTAGEVVSSDATYKTLNQYHINCDIYLAGATRNVGGDDILGNDITNLFMRIALQNTLEDALVKQLANKLTLNLSGVTTVKTATSQELLKYVNNGYICTDKSWQEEDLYIDGNLVAKQGQPLLGGYIVYVSPITSTHKQTHTLPNVYILYADQLGVRKIVVNGEVF